MFGELTGASLPVECDQPSNPEISQADGRCLHTPPCGHPSPEGIFRSGGLDPLYEEGWRAAVSTSPFDRLRVVSEVEPL